MLPGKWKREMLALSMLLAIAAFHLAPTMHAFTEVIVMHINSLHVSWHLCKHSIVPSPRSHPVQWEL